MIHHVKTNYSCDEVRYYVSYEVSNGRAYFDPAHVLYVESCSLGPDVTIHMNGGRTIYAKEKLEVILEEVFGNPIPKYMDKQNGN